MIHVHWVLAEIAYTKSAMVKIVIELVRSINLCIIKKAPGDDEEEAQEL